MGFPELEFSANEVFSWPREEQVKSPAAAYGAAKQSAADPGRNTVILKDSCQIVTPVSSNDVSKNVKDRNYGLSSPGNIQSYLEVVDLMSSRLRYVGVEIAQCLKITQNVAFDFFNFSIFYQFLSY